MSQQGHFDFGADGAESGLSAWRVGRKMAAAELARKLNLPLDHQVEVWLQGGIMLRGRLRLQTELLFIEEERVRHLPLVVDGVAFHLREMESCVRMD